MTFRTVLKQGGKTATGFRVPDVIVAKLGAGKRPRVRVTIKGHTYRSTIAVMRGVFMIGVSAQVRATAGVAGGDTVDVGLELDLEPRVVEVPSDLQQVLDASATMRKRFEALSHSKKQQLVLPIDAAKKPETRQARLERAITVLKHLR